MKVSNLAKTGVLTVVSCCILFLGINFLKGKNIFSNLVNYEVYYNRVDGLVRSSAITINGLKVGQVSEIKLAEDGSGKIIVTFTIPKDIKLPINTVAKIVSTDLMGTRSIKLLLAPDQHQYYKPNDIIPGDIEKDLKEEVSMQVLPLKNKAEQLMGSLDSAMTVVTYVFNQKTRENLRESFQHINSTILNIEVASKDLRDLLGSEKYVIAHIINNVDSIASNLNHNSKHFNRISKNLAAFSDTLSTLKLQTTLAKTSYTLDQVNLILTKINNQEGSMGLLINNPELYNNLKRTSNSLDILLHDIKVNPQKYVHFSAFDLGKKVYYSPNAQAKENIIFKILLVSTKTPITDLPKYFGEIKIEEIKTRKNYLYFTGTMTTYNEAVKNKENLREHFPDAKVIAFQKGKIINLSKALKRQ